jgi:molybdopterin-containing oxidoreductase family membrane subunit
MLQEAIRGGRGYWTLVAFWGVLILIGMGTWGYQLSEGLHITGMNQDITWGIYIAQLTFMVGIAASAVMVVLPYYLHDYKAFGKMVIIGEGLAVSSVLMCMLFVFVDLGQPARGANIILHPSPNSVMFWDMLVLSGYLGLNLVIGAVTFEAERKGAPPPKWVKPLIFLSIPWAVSIHTVTAFLYSGLEARTFWMTAILAPRFLASAFATGPSLLILLALILRRFTTFDAGKVAIQKLAMIVAYAVAINLFFLLVELFTVLYSSMPHHTDAFRYMFFGLEGNNTLAPLMWIGQIIGVFCLIALWVPKARANETFLAVLAVGVILSLWLEKGVGLVVIGFIPAPLGQVTEYVPTLPEAVITIGVYAIGFMLLTIFYKIIVTVRDRLGPA